MLINSLYYQSMGELPKYYVHDCHPAIIDRETFRKVQEEIARRSSKKRTFSRTGQRSSKSFRKRGSEGSMKYYVTSDVHGFYTPLREVLASAG